MVTINSPETSKSDTFKASKDITIPTSPTTIQDSNGADVGVKFGAKPKDGKATGSMTVGAISGLAPNNTVTLELYCGSTKVASGNANASGGKVDPTAMTGIVTGTQITAKWQAPSGVTLKNGSSVTVSVSDVGWGQG